MNNNYNVNKKAQALIDAQAGLFLNQGLSIKAIQAAFDLALRAGRI